MELLTLSRVFVPAEADLLAARLESAGFTPFVHGLDAALSIEGYSMVTGGIQVKVPADQAESARQFLAGGAYDPGWDGRFRAVYDRAMAAYRSGRCSPATLCDAADTAFLRESGCSVQELYDFVEDAVDCGEPEFDTVLEVQRIRRDWFLGVQQGRWTGRTVPMSELPAKSDAVDGIAWLPRLIVKARLKLRGEMPSDLMYGCGGDRPFLRRMGMTLPGFLELVRDRGHDDRAIVEAVKACRHRAGHRD
jgi:hypothetical protein